MYAATSDGTLHQLMGKPFISQVHSCLYHMIEMTLCTHYVLIWMFWNIFELLWWMVFPSPILNAWISQYKSAERIRKTLVRVICPQMMKLHNFTHLTDTCHKWNPSASLFCHSSKLDIQSGYAWWSNKWWKQHFSYSIEVKHGTVNIKLWEGGLRVYYSAS